MRIAIVLSLVLGLAASQAEAKSRRVGINHVRLQSRVRKMHEGWYFNHPAKVWIRWFDRRRSYLVTCRFGGETTHQARRRAKGRFAFGGGYYHSPKRRDPVDLVIVWGGVKKGYHCKARPVFVIFKAAKPPTIVKRWSKKLKNDVLFALAGDGRCQDPSRVTYRQVIGISSDRVFFVRLVGREADCHRLMRGIGISQYMFLDGGSAVGDAVLVPTHIVVAAK